MMIQHFTEVSTQTMTVNTVSPEMTISICVTLSIISLIIICGVIDKRHIIKRCIQRRRNRGSGNSENIPQGYFNRELYSNQFHQVGIALPPYMERDPFGMGRPPAYDETPNEDLSPGVQTNCILPNVPPGRDELENVPSYGDYLPHDGHFLSHMLSGGSFRQHVPPGDYLSHVPPGGHFLSRVPSGGDFRQHVSPGHYLSHVPPGGHFPSHVPSGGHFRQHMSLGGDSIPYMSPSADFVSYVHSGGDFVPPGGYFLPHVPSGDDFIPHVLPGGDFLYVPPGDDFLLHVPPGGYDLPHVPPGGDFLQYASPSSVDFPSNIPPAYEQYISSTSLNSDTSEDNAAHTLSPLNNSDTSDNHDLHTSPPPT